jgi:hypothetical protein
MDAKKQECGMQIECDLITANVGAKRTSFQRAGKIEESMPKINYYVTAIGLS